MGVVELCDDKLMTYIIGMTSDDGVLMGADGRVLQYRDGQHINTLDDGQKIFQVNDRVLMGFAGAVTNIEGFIAGQAVLIDGWNGDYTIEDVAHLTTRMAAANLDATLRRNNRNLEVIVGGLDLDDDGQPTIPKLYLYRRVITPEAFEDLRPIIDIRDAGYRGDFSDELVDAYRSGGKDYDTLRGHVLRGVRESEQVCPTEVGGNVTIYHLTQNGIDVEVISEQDRQQQ